MGKKTSRAKYTSKGKYPSVSRETVKLVRRERPEVEKVMNQLRHWERGKRTVVTIPNPNKNETNKRFIRVEGNHPAAFGPWKREDRKKTREMAND